MPARVTVSNNLKRPPIPVVPTNAAIVNPDGTVTRTGKLLLQQLQAPTTLQGTHGARPDPTAAPDGAVYVESDRTVLYSSIDGAWHYIAGTMWGAINPDQRPKDLGVNDAGFDFRTVDQPAREFIWSQAYWVEVTPVRYGTHAARLAVDVTRVIEQMLWVETDRTVLYQLMQVSGTTPVWQYIAGTMWGTLSPDQRPTDLGTHDAGFDFRGTDQPREFIWSQTAWIETTPVGGASGLIHPNVVTRVGSTAGQIAEGGILDQSAANSNTVQISATGNVGIGVAPTYPLHVVRAESSPNLAGIQQLAISSTGAFAGYCTWIGYGNPGIGANIGAVQALAGGSGTLLSLNPSGGGVAVGMYSGTVYEFQVGTDSAGKPSTSTWTIVSDIRTKRNVYPFEGDMEVIRRLEPIVGEYNGLAGTPAGARVVGFDAAKLREIVPQCVSGARGKLRESDAEETEVLGVNIHEILMHMLRAVQQIDRRLSALEGAAPRR